MTEQEHVVAIRAAEEERYSVTVEQLYLPQIGAGTMPPAPLVSTVTVHLGRERVSREV